MNYPFRTEALQKAIANLIDLEGKKLFVLSCSEFDQAEVLATQFIKDAKAKRIKHIVWVAPAHSNSTYIRKAEHAIVKSKIYYNIVYYPLLFSEPFLPITSIREKRVFGLPAKILPWCSLSDVAAHIQNAKPNTITTIEGEFHNGERIAKKIERALHEVKESDKLLRNKFQLLDKAGAGSISYQTINTLMISLGFQPAEIKAILEKIDTNNDGSIQYSEFISEFGDNLKQMLEPLDTSISWICFPEKAYTNMLVDDYGFSLENARQTTAFILEKLSTHSEEVMNNPTGLKHWLDTYLMDIFGVEVIPGQGLFINKVFVTDNVITHHSRIIKSDGKDISIKRNPKFTHIKREGIFNHDRLLHYENQEVNFKLFLKDDFIVEIQTEGAWSGLSEAITYLFNDDKIKSWQRPILLEFGKFHIEENPNVSSESMVCNCLQLSRKDFTPLIEKGVVDFKELVNQTKATTVCGGCQPAVEALCGQSSFKQATLTEKLPTENKSIERYKFKPVDGFPKQIQPGQHVVIQAYIQNNWVTRSFTLTSSSNPGDTYEIAVKREEMGAFSRWLSDHATAETLFRISEPQGDFYLKNDQRDVVFFAAGIGVTPAISMLRTLRTQNDFTRFSLDWSIPFSQNFFLTHEINKIEKAVKTITVKKRATRINGHLTKKEVERRYPYFKGRVAFLCGPESFMNTVKMYLKENGWPDEAIFQERFSSKAITVEKQKDIVKEVPLKENSTSTFTFKPVESKSFFITPIQNMYEEAEAFLKQFYVECKLSKEAFESRWKNVQQEIRQTGSYTHTIDELVFASRVAWRNSTRCVGRYFWGNMIVRDCRLVDTEKGVFESLVKHLRLGFNEGDIRSVISIFNHKTPRIRIWNPLLLLFAGYENEDGTILGDPAHVALTKQALRLGWKPKEGKSKFDLLPLIVEFDGRQPQWFDWPEDIRRCIPIEHPEYEWFKDLGLKWHAIPAVSGMAFDAGGLQYRCAPSNGFYISTEVGARNLGDVKRYNSLPVIAKKMGLNFNDNESHWKDRAVVELNLAVQYSFKKAKVRMLDHHTITTYFMKFHGQESKAGRPTYADWPWIVPPISGSTNETYHLEMTNRILKPNYFYQKEAWDCEEWREISGITSK